MSTYSPWFPAVVVVLGSAPLCFSVVAEEVRALAGQSKRARQLEQLDTIGHEVRTLVVGRGT